MQKFVIGDGTAPKGFPSYSAYKKDKIMCNFNRCGHIGTRECPSKMECGTTCNCSCCRMLAGAVVFGCSYGPYNPK